MDRSVPLVFGFGNTSSAHVWMKILFQLVPARLELRTVCSSIVTSLDWIVREKHHLIASLFHIAQVRWYIIIVAVGQNKELVLSIHHDD